MIGAYFSLSLFSSMLISKFNSSHFNYHMAIVLHTNDDDDDMRDYADAKVVKTRKHDNNHASH